MMFAVIALILVATFWLLDGLLRARIQRRRTGDTGIRIPTTPQQWWARGTLALGMLLAGIAAPVAELLALPPIPLLDHVPIRVTGIAVAATAVAATFAAQLAMGPSWRTTIDPNERPPLVTGGIFHLVRNPIYSALIIMVIGLTLLVPNAIALAGLATIITGSQLQVRLIEEPYLHRIHGTSYHKYASRVGRFLPGIGRLRSQRDYRT
jgi:protein-S-isoprenylcysteine O-methyltransferase Ste14